MEREQSTSDPLVKDIDPAARQWIERLMGRPLSDEERLYILAYRPDDVLHKSGRHAARARLLELMDQAAAHVEQLGVPDEELDEAIQEAIDDVRGRRSPQGS